VFLGDIRGHPYKILEPHSCCTARAIFFAERIINTWNSLPHDSIDFSSLRAFQRGIEENDFSMFFMFVLVSITYICPVLI